MITWREEITIEMKYNGDSWDNVISCTLNESQLDTVFDAGYGEIEGSPFAVYTHEYIYFPKEYDGSEHCVSVPRNPTGNAIAHI